MRARAMCGALLSRVLEALASVYESIAALFAVSRTMEGGTVVLLGARLAEGGFATVYAGRVVGGGGGAVAVKVARFADAAARADLEAELAYHRRFDDARLVRVLDAAFFPDGECWLVLPLLGPSLRSFVDGRRAAPGGAPSPGEIRSAVGDAADGLAHMHARGVCHRDVKPENILFGGGGRCVLADFGSCARFVDGERVATRRAAAGLADAAACRTTMSHRPPELWAPTVGDPVDGRPDVWALGAVLWFAAFGYGAGPEKSTYPRRESLAIVCFEERIHTSRP